MKKTIVSFLEGVGRTVVKTVKFIQDKGRKGVKKVKGYADKVISQISNDTGFMSVDEKRELFDNSYKRDTSKLSDEDAARINQEDYDRYLRDMRLVAEAKDDMRANTFAILLVSFVTTVTAVAITSITGNSKIGETIRDATDETVAWNGAYK